MVWPDRARTRRFSPSLSGGLRGGPLPRALDERDQRLTRVLSVGDRRLEGEARETRADAQVAALGVDADERRAVAREAAELARIERHRVGVVAVHMRDDVGLGRGERGGRVIAWMRPKPATTCAPSSATR